MRAFALRLRWLLLPAAILSGGCAPQSRVEHLTAENRKLEAANRRLQAAYQSCQEAGSVPGDLALGLPLTEPQAVLDGELRVTLYSRHVAVMQDVDGAMARATIPVRLTGEPVKPYGDIGRYARVLGRSIGPPLHGEHVLFGGAYRMHVFTNGVVIWRRHDRRCVDVTSEEPFGGHELVTAVE
jgi:hypothetical protein